MELNRLKVVLVERKKTGKWLAETLGKNEATVSRWCANVSQPSLETLFEIAKVLEVDVRELLTKEEDIKVIQPYLDELERSLAEEGLTNIAVTGAYGSGKSTIIKTFQYLHSEYEYLNISLASFKDNDENGKKINSFSIRENKIKVLNKQDKELNNSQIQGFIETFGGNYEKLFKKQNKPTFSNTDYHKSLFDNLQRRGLIKRYEEIKDNQLKVFANY